MSTNTGWDDLVVRTAEKASASVPLYRIQQKFPLVVSSSASGSGLDAFGRQRVSNPVTLFDSSMEVDSQPLLWNNVTTGSGGSTYNENQSSVSLTTGAASSSSIRQSRQYMRYQPGKSLLSFFTFVLGARTTSVTRRVGMYDVENGIFLEQAGGVREVSTMDTTGGTFTTGTFFNIWDASGTKYYVWLDVDGDGTTDDPLPDGSATRGTSVPVDISGGASEAQVATAVAAAIDALAGFSASALVNVITITNAAVGAASDITSRTLVGWADTGTVTVQGVSSSIAWVVRSNTSGVQEVSSLDTTGGTFTSGTYFIIYSANDETKYYVWLDTAGDGITNKPVETGTSVPADISGGASASQVATAVAKALNNLGDFEASASTNVVTIRNSRSGPCTDIASVDLVSWADDGSVTIQGSGGPVDTRVEQASWDIDKLDGTGRSVKTYSEANANIGIIDLEWLGVGRIRVGFVIDGEIQYAHGFENLGVNMVYMERASLPMRYEIVSGAGASGSSSLLQICSTVISEGGYIPRGMIRAASQGASSVTLATATRLPLIALRLKSAYARATLLPLQVTVFNSDTNDAVNADVRLRATLTGGTWVSVSEAVEMNITATAVSGGYVIANTYIAAAAKGETIDVGNLEDSTLVLASSYTGVQDVFVVTGLELTGSAAVYASVQWREIF